MNKSAAENAPLKTCVAALSGGQRSSLDTQSMSSSFAGPFSVAGRLAFARLRLARALSFRYKSKDFVSYCCLTSLIKHQPSAEVALPAAAQRRAVFQARISGAPSGQARCSESVLWRTLTRRDKTGRRISRDAQIGLVFASSQEKTSNAQLSLPAVVGEWSRRDASDIDG